METNISQLSLPYVTVIIPNHNYGQWIEKAVDSVAKDEYPNKRIVIVDDGSTDDSWKIITGLIHEPEPQVNPTWDGVIFGNAGFRHDPLTNSMKKVRQKTFIKTVRLPTANGPSTARNVGMQTCHANTDLFAFLDADDYWYKGKVTESVKAWLEAPTEIGLIYSDNVTVNSETGLVIEEFREPFDRYRLMNHNMIDSSYFVSKLALDKIGLFDPELRVAEDLDVSIRVTEHFMAVHIPEILNCHLVHPNNTTSSVKRETWQRCWARVYDKMRQRMENSNG